jgi:8-oxo-dGTP pyrophosphatase MutT (NUDIX family)
MHTHRGIYFICLNDHGQLLTIEKGGGPYKNRLDLPGGTPEAGETDMETVRREVLEETGYAIQSADKIGERLYEIPWSYKQWTISHHTAVYFSGKIDESTKLLLADIPDQDSKGVLWIDPYQLLENWCSPLVWEAKQYILNNEISSKIKIYHAWNVLQTPEFVK